MSQITLKGNTIHTNGELAKVGEKVSDFTMVKNDLSETTLFAVKDTYKILNIFPSIDTPTCAMSVREFNKRGAETPNTLVLNISKDLPFAQKRFCGAEGIERAETASVFRSQFASDFGVEMIDGPLKGLCSRAVVVLDKDNNVLYSELVSEIASEPNYEAALAALKNNL